MRAFTLLIYSPGNIKSNWKLKTKVGLLGVFLVSSEFKLPCIIITTYILLKHLMYIVTFILTINARHSQTQFGGVIISRKSKRGSIKKVLSYNIML